MQERILQIRQSADLFVAGLFRGRFYTATDLFIAGANWADKHPAAQSDTELQELKQKIIAEHNNARTRDASRVLERLLPELAKS